MCDAGSTRIDTVLATPAGAAAVHAVKYRWDLLGVDHVPIQIELNSHIFSQQMMVPLIPTAINTTEAMRTSPEVAHEIAQKAFEPYRESFEKALAEEDLDRAHEIWCDISVAHLIQISGKARP